ncbi:MAG: dihydroneopterin aldolase [Candidatus Phosphoribacter sp.]|nr:dihydroneopterin aldolase [Actinomycetales bacterium]
MTDRIVIQGIEGTGFHGVFEHERRDGQRFVVDVVLELDLRRPARSDNLTDTVHYGEVAAAVVSRIEGEPFDLIERLAEVIAADLLESGAVDAVEVVVHKPQAPVPVPFTDISVEIRRERGVPVVVAVGSNLGDRVRTLTEAVEMLADLPGFTITAVPPLVLSAAIGGIDQPTYLNGVVLGTFSGSPASLLRGLHGIEHAHGRTREVRWGARTLDLDLVQFGVPGSARERLSAEPSLLLPHPGAIERAFVLLPWAHADPEATMRLGHSTSDPIVRVADRAADLGGHGIHPGPEWSPAW